MAGSRRQSLGLSHQRRWFDCGHPDRGGLAAESLRRALPALATAHATAAPVCPCDGCGPRCPGYATGPSDGDQP